MSTSKITTLACALALGLAIPATAMAGDGQKQDKVVQNKTMHDKDGHDKATDKTMRDRTEREEQAGLNMERPDAWVLTKVKAKFATSDLVEATDINIDVKDGVAQLRGTVGSSAERREAVRLAEETEGVKKVDASGLRMVTEPEKDR